jgi:hypothetical protein
VKIRAPRAGTLPRAQVTAIGVISGLLSLVVVDVLLGGMALLPAALLTLVVAVVIVVLVATVVATFTGPLQRLTDRVLGDEEPPPDSGAGSGPG